MKYIEVKKKLCEIQSIFYSTINTSNKKVILYKVYEMLKNDNCHLKDLRPKLDLIIESYFKELQKEEKKLLLKINKFEKTEL